MTEPWKIAHVNFREDDGSLPTIEFDELRESSVASIFGQFRSRGSFAGAEPTVWDKPGEIERPLRSLEDPCELLFEGRIEPFHCCFDGIEFDQTQLPRLGLFVFRDSIEIDYRMGPERNARTTDSFLRFIAHLKALAPEAVVKSAEGEGVPDEDAFFSALRAYLD